MLVVRPQEALIVWSLSLPPAPLCAGNSVNAMRSPCRPCRLSAGDGAWHRAGQHRLALFVSEVPAEEFQKENENEREGETLDIFTQEPVMKMFTFVPLHSNFVIYQSVQKTKI